MTPRGRMPKCPYCGLGVPDEAAVDPTPADYASPDMDAGGYHPKCLERARERVALLKRQRRERLR